MGIGKSLCSDDQLEVNLLVRWVKSWAAGGSVLGGG